MTTMRIYLILAIILGISGGELRSAPHARIDVLLKGGTIVDGAGGEPYVGDVAVAGDWIVAVGDVEAGEVGRTIDCEGLIICPGFIDLHNHSDHSILTPDTRDARCYLTQGCTTLVTGNCGGGRHDIAKFYQELEQSGVGVNIAQLVPHGTLRAEVMGKVRRAPSATELAKIQELAAQGMREGAWGMSTGLQYVPGAYAQTDELISIASVVGKHGGIYASHMRDEGDELIEAIEEVLHIARSANLPCHISHLKSSKDRNWGKIRAAARLVEQARAGGLRITADQYPYTASSTSIMAMLLPDEEREGGEHATAERLKSAQERDRLRPLIAKSIEERGQLMISSFSIKPEWVGKMLSDIAKEEGREPVEIGLELLSDAKAQGVNFGMDENDVRFAMTMPWVATASDGSAKIDDGTRPHPRSYGTFPRKIGWYAVHEQVLPLAAAIRSASGLPADIMGMNDRGYVRANQAADLVIFKRDEFRDRATYEKPFAQSVGVRWLLVNGQIAIAEGEPQNILAGRPLRHAENGAVGGE
jgi:N-acyl-D-aspartate/D-glutamate deacylase